MDREQARERLSALLDGELGTAEQAQVQAWIARDALLRAEYEDMAAIRRSIAGAFTPPLVAAAEWDDIALQVVSRQGERLGFTFLLPGALALIVGALAAVFASERIALWLRVGLGAMTAGLAFLLASAIAQRVRMRRIERYDEVER